jgi:dihydrolipoamide dehydrogenase
VQQLRSGQLATLGIEAPPPSLNYAQTQRWKNQTVATLRQGIAHLLGKHGVAQVQGQAYFEDAHTLRITPTTGDTPPLTLTPDAVVLATGASPIGLPFLPDEAAWLLDSQGLLALETLPDALLVVGAGVIGLEMATLMAQLGVKVSVIEAQPTLLNGWDDTMKPPLCQSLEALGVELHLGATLQHVHPHNDAWVEATWQSAGSSAPSTHRFNKVLVAVGRTPNTQGLGLEAAGIALTPQGTVAVDACFQTSQAHVWAIGDCIAGPQLAHRASKEALHVAEGIATGQAHPADWLAMPSVIYTTPELATVGLTPAQAKAEGLPVAVGKVSWGAMGMAHAQQATTGWVQLVAHAQSDVLLGAQAVGEQASTLIAEIALAIELGATAADVALTVHPHPSRAEGWMEAAEAVHQQAIHVYQPGKRLAAVVAGKA